MKKKKKKIRNGQMKLYISETQSLLEENKYMTLPSKRLKHLKQRPCTGGVLEEDSHTPLHFQILGQDCARQMLLPFCLIWL